MIFLFAFHWESELGYTLGTRLGKGDRGLFWGNSTSPFCCWGCQSLCWEHGLLRSRRAAWAEQCSEQCPGWSMGNASTWSKTQQRLKPPKLQGRRIGPVQCQSQRGYFCTIVRMSGRLTGSFSGNGTSLASHPSWIQGEECRLPCSCDTQLLLSLCCQYTNITQRAPGSSILI